MKTRTIKNFPFIFGYFPDFSLYHKNAGEVVVKKSIPDFCILIITSLSMESAIKLFKSCENFPIIGLLC